MSAWVVAVSEVHAIGHAQLDLSRPEQIKSALADIKADLIINPAAYTAVDNAESDVDLCFTINRDAVAEIAEHCARQSIPLIHYSTDYVFAGDAERPYLETDETAPNGVYGESKLAGEHVLCQRLNKAAKLFDSLRLVCGIAEFYCDDIAGQANSRACDPRFIQSAAYLILQIRQRKGLEFVDGQFQEEVRSALQVQSKIDLFMRKEVRQRP